MSLNKSNTNTLRKIFPSVLFSLSTSQSLQLQSFPLSTVYLLLTVFIYNFHGLNCFSKLPVSVSSLHFFLYHVYLKYFIFISFYLCVFSCLSVFVSLSPVSLYICSIVYLSACLSAVAFRQTLSSVSSLSIFICTYVIFLYLQCFHHLYLCRFHFTSTAHLYLYRVHLL